MSESPKVDIIIPVYNTSPQLLKRCIRSVLEQSYLNIGIILVDDGSTNRETRLAIDDIKKNDSVEIVRKKNGGVASARNVGLRRAKNNYVYFLDSDDCIEREHIGLLVKKSLDKKAKIVFSGRINSITGINDAPFAEQYINLARDVETIVIKAYAFTCNAVLIDTEIAKSISFSEDLKFGEDTEYIIRAIAKARAYYYGCGGNIYYQNENSITHDTSIEASLRYLDDSMKLRDAFVEVLKADDEIVDIYVFNKLLLFYRKISVSFALRQALSLIKSVVKERRIKAPKINKIVKNRQLGRKQKILMIVLKLRCFLALWLYNRITYGKKVA